MTNEAVNVHAESATTTVWINAKVAGDLLGTHDRAVRKMADLGCIRSRQLPGGHRRFSLSDCIRLAGESERVPGQSTSRTEIFAR